MTTREKLFRDLSFAHRIPGQGRQCLVHGHNWTIQAVFVSPEAQDFAALNAPGTLAKIAAILNPFEHALVLNADDPHLSVFQTWDGTDPRRGPVKLFNLVTVPDASCEGLAKYFCEQFQDMLSKQTNARVAVASVTVFEDSEHSATYSLFREAFPNWPTPPKVAQHQIA